MAEFKIEHSDVLRLRYEVLKHFATISGVGIAAGMGLVDKFKLVDPALAVFGIVAFAIAIGVSVYSLLRLATVEKNGKRLIVVSGVCVLLGVYLLIASFGVSVFRQIEREVEQSNKAEVQQRKPSASAPIVEDISGTVPTVGAQPQGTPIPTVGAQPQRRFHRWQWWRN